MSDSGLDISTAITLGPVTITDTVITTWVIMLCLGFISWLLTRKLSASPNASQTAIEAIIIFIEDTISDVAPQQTKLLMPLIGSLWIFIVIANLVGLLPGAHSPTRDLSATAALAIIVFLSVHWYGIRIQGIREYLKHYIHPSPILLPFHLVSEITRTVALSVRLFGNMMSLEMAALLVLLVAGFLAPIPLLMLHIIEALVQAYIFGMLALVYVAGGIQSQQLKQNNTKE